MTGGTGLIIGLLAVGLLGLTVYSVAQSFRRSLTGQILQLLTEEIRSGKGVSEEEIAETPRSLSAMDSIYLPRIQRDFPEFNWSQWKSVLQDAVERRMRALDERNGELIRMHPAVYMDVENILKNPPVPRYRNREIYQTVISGYTKSRGLVSILTETSASSICYVEQEGKLLAGSDSLRHQTVFEAELLYVQDAELALEDIERNSPGAGNEVQEPASARKIRGYNCPNCGAPVTSLGNKICAYCGSSLEGINTRVWTIQRITEEDFYRKELQEIRGRKQHIET